MPAIGRPFPGIAQHARQAKGIGVEGVDRPQQLVVPLRCRSHCSWHGRRRRRRPTSAWCWCRRGRHIPIPLRWAADRDCGCRSPGWAARARSIDPGDEGFGVLPVQAHRRPARRLDIGGGGGLAAMQLLPAQHQQRIAGLRLVAGGIEEGQKLLAGDRVLGQGEGLHRHHMLRAFGIEAPRLMRRAAHQEFAGRDAPPSAEHSGHSVKLRSAGLPGPSAAERRRPSDGKADFMAASKQERARGAKPFCLKQGGRP